MASLPAPLPGQTYLTTHAHRREIKDKETLIAPASVTRQTRAHTHTQGERDREFTHISWFKKSECVSINNRLLCFSVISTRSSKVAAASQQTFRGLEVISVMVRLSLLRWLWSEPI